MGKIYQVVVIGFKGDRSTIDLCNTEEQMLNMTGLQLRQKIAERFPGNAGNRLDNIRLIFTDKVVADGSTLSSYGIQHQSVIQMVMTVPGGDQL